MKSLVFLSDVEILWSTSGEGREVDLLHLLALRGKGAATKPISKAVLLQINQIMP